VYSLGKVIPPLSFVASLLASDFSSKGQGNVNIVDEEVSSMDVNAPGLRSVALVLMVCCCSKDLNGIMACSAFQVRCYSQQNTGLCIQYIAFCPLHLGDILSPSVSSHDKSNPLPSVPGPTILLYQLCDDFLAVFESKLYDLCE
jgi:hypothetical protein